MSEKYEDGKSFAVAPVAVCATAIALSLMAPAARAQTAYDFFNYPPGPISGQNGGGGWAGPWAGTGNVVSPGLTLGCNGQAPSGNGLGPTTGSAATRTFDTPVSGASGTSLILSAVIKSNVNGGTFTQATLGNSSGGTFIIGELPETDPNAKHWGLQNSAGVYYSSTATVMAGVETCLVAQIDFSVSGVSGGLDRMRLWVNPPSDRSTVTPDIDQTTAHVAVFSGIFWQTQQGQIVDEISVNSGGGAWSELNNTYAAFTGSSPDAALLLTDGTVLVHDGSPYPAGTGWYKFTPDNYGNYINGAWSKAAGLDKMLSTPKGFLGYAPFAFPSAVLPDGRVIIEGGEDNFADSNNKNAGAIYDPTAGPTGTWTFVPPPSFGDTCGINGNHPPSGTSWCSTWGPSVVLPNGNFMLGDGDDGSATGNPPLQAMLPPPYTGPWIQVDRSGSKHDSYSEEGWTLLPSAPGELLVMTVDTYSGLDAGTAFICGGHNSSELYFSLSLGPFSFDKWYCLGQTPLRLTPAPAHENEMGPAVLRPDGTVFQAGANEFGATAILDTSLKWKSGPLFPMDEYGNQLRMVDGPAALLPNGNVLMMTSQYSSTSFQQLPPAVFFELTPDPSNVLVEVPGVFYACNIGSAYGQMLVLPTGQIWFTPNRGAGGSCTPHPFSDGIEIYTPNNQKYDPAWAPTLSAKCFICRVYQSQTNKWSGQRFSGKARLLVMSTSRRPITRWCVLPRLSPLGLPGFTTVEPTASAKGWRLAISPSRPSSTVPTSHWV